MAPGLPKFKIGPFPDFRSSDNTTVISPSICRCSDPEQGSPATVLYIAQEARVYTRRVISATLVLLTNTNTKYLEIKEYRHRAYQNR